MKLSRVRFSKSSRGRSGTISHQKRLQSISHSRWYRADVGSPKESRGGGSSRRSSPALFTASLETATPSSFTMILLPDTERAPHVHSTLRRKAVKKKGRLPRRAPRLSSCFGCASTPPSSPVMLSSQMLRRACSGSQVFLGRGAR